MTAFDPEALIAAIEHAGAAINLVLYDDGSRAWSVGFGTARADDLPSMGGLSDEQVDALLETLWQQGKCYYGGPRRHRA